MNLSLKISAGSIVHFGQKGMDNIRGFEQVSSDEAETYAERGHTTVEQPGGQWLVARYVDDAIKVEKCTLGDDANAVAIAHGFKEAIPTDWCVTSADKALELKAKGVKVVEFRGGMLAPMP